MLQFTLRRIVFILLVCVFIIFSVHLGMRMIRNSETQDPNFDLLAQSQLAWGDTRGYLDRALDGDFGVVRETHGQVPILDILREAYLNSMGLLVVALARAAWVGRRPERGHEDGIIDGEYTVVAEPDRDTSEASRDAEPPR